MICDDQARNVAQSTSEQLGRGNLTDVTITGVHIMGDPVYFFVMH